MQPVDKKNLAVPSDMSILWFYDSMVIMYFIMGVAIGLLTSIVCMLAAVFLREKIERNVHKVEAAALKKPATIINTSNPFKDLWTLHHTMIASKLSL